MRKVSTQRSQRSQGNLLKIFSVITVISVFTIVSAVSALSAGRTLDIYVVDVEGGNATLIVSPAGQSLLIDTGNLNGAKRDVDRIIAAANDAGIRQIDHLIITHWHADHYGGLAELAGRMPIRHFIDHGANAQPAQAVDEFLRTQYPSLYGRATRTVAKAGDRIAMDGLDVRVLSSAGHVIQTPMTGAGAANPYCASFKAGDNNAED